jgi:hypothetical protein
MALVSKHGLMEPGTKASGTITKLKVKVFFGMLKVIFMMENSRMTRLTVMAFIHMSMGLSMKATGKMICRKVMVLRYGVMEPSTLAAIRKARSITMEYMSG